MARREDLPKHSPLLTPVDPADNGSQIPLVQFADRRQEQKLFLKIGSQMQQLHDLGYPGTRHALGAHLAQVMRAITNELGVREVSEKRT